MKFKDGDMIEGHGYIGVVIYCVPDDNSYEVQWNNEKHHTTYSEHYIDNNFTLSVKRMRNRKLKEILG